MKLLIKASLICLVLTLNACGGNEPVPTDTITPKKDEVAKPAEFAPKPSPTDSYGSGVVLFPWVNQLNVREAPNTTAKRIGKA